VGDDRLRSLDERGRRQAEALVILLGGRQIDRLLSSPYVRCVQSVQPLARARGLEVEPVDELAEGADADAALELLSGAGEAVGACVHGDLMEAVLGHGEPKGSTTVLQLDSAPPKLVERLPPPA
jgi:8-oxo-dGTP diphosphatase